MAEISGVRELIEVIQENTKSAEQLKSTLNALQKSNEFSMQRMIDTLTQHNANTREMAESIEKTVRGEAKGVKSHITIRLLIAAAALTAAFGAGIAIAEKF